MANKRAIEDRNRKLEASHKAISNEIKILRMKDGLDEIEKNQAIHKARKDLQRAADEKRDLKAALAEAQEFISQPEVRAMFEKHQAHKREQAQSRAQQESQTPPREEQRPGLGLGH